MKKSSILLFAFIAACAPAPQQQVFLPQLLPTATAYIDESYPTAEAILADPNRSASGIDVRIERVWVDGKSVNADVCFTLPDQSDWSIWSASLIYGESFLQEYGAALVRLQEPAEGAPGLRCDTLTFIVPPDAELFSAAVVINSIAAPPREDEYCSVYLPKIQQAMEERGTGITLDCIDTDGALTMRITGFPSSMTQQQAEEIVYSDEFFTITGPWTFSFDLSP